MPKKTEKKEEKKTNNFEELKKQIMNLKNELLNLRLEHAQGKLKNTSSLTLKRKEIAKLLTMLRISELTK